MSEEIKPEPKLESKQGSTNSGHSQLEVEVEYVYEPPPDDDLVKNFSDVFEKFAKFQAAPVQKKGKIEKEKQPPKSDQTLALVSKDDQYGEDMDLDETASKTDKDKKISKRKLKEVTRMSVADLKQRISRPELVELHDISAQDPIFLLNLKSIKNSVPVPRHWSSKRKYLQGKRGFEKPPFLLPDFIRQTGIMEMRESIQDKDGAKSLKAKTRERMQPKMGKIQMDYQQLHDAFFKWQTRPKLSTHGDLYYEGKEFERKFKKKPGELSNELRKALGMPTGSRAHRYPPPWLTAMKRHGPPPSYPYLKIPGLNCPFPDEIEGENDEDHVMDDTSSIGSDGE